MAVRWIGNHNILWFSCKCVLGASTITISMNVNDLFESVSGSPASELAQRENEVHDMATRASELYEMASRPLSNQLQILMKGVAKSQSEFLADSIRTFTHQDSDVISKIRELATARTDSLASQSIEAVRGAALGISTASIASQSIDTFKHAALALPTISSESDLIKSTVAGIIGSVQNSAGESVTSWAEAFELKNDTLQEIVRRFQIDAQAPFQQARDVFREETRRASDFTPRYEIMRPLSIQPPNLAELKIDAIIRDENEKRADLADDQKLNMYLITGGGMFLVADSQAFTAKDAQNIEIEVFDGERFQTVSMNYTQVVVYYETVDMADDMPETIH